MELPPAILVLPLRLSRSSPGIQSWEPKSSVHEALLCDNFCALCGPETQLNGNLPAVKWAGIHFNGKSPCSDKDYCWRPAVLKVMVRTSFSFPRMPIGL